MVILHNYKGPYESQRGAECCEKVINGLLSTRLHGLGLMAKVALDILRGA